MNKTRYLVLRISFALGIVAVAGILACNQAGIFPDTQALARQARGKLCETLGASLSLGPIQQGPEVAKQHLVLFRKRNPHAISLGLRREKGQLITQDGDHSTHWHNALAEHPDQCYVVPIVRGGSKWGNLEVFFASQAGWSGLNLIPSWLTPALIVGGSVFALAWLSLSRILTHLDPSRVVPERVKETLDNFAEGVLLLDQDEQIVLVNSVFTQHLGETSDSMIGRLASTLPWKTDSDEGTAILPWQDVKRTEQPVRCVPLQMETPLGRQHFSVNAVPVVDDQGTWCGTLVAFAEVTELEEKKRNLTWALSELSASHQDIAQKNRQLEFLATRDPLTGCFNRRSLFESFAKCWDYAKRNISDLSCIMVDIDFFKSINDKHGHQKGDEVLKATGSLLLELSREYDLPARYGGEEFCVVLPGADLDDATEFAERIRKRLASLDFGEFHITASLGVSSIEFGAADPQGIIDQADQCLYAAKRNGRNQTVRFDEIDQDAEIDKSIIARTEAEAGA